MPDQSPDPGYQCGLTGAQVESALNLAASATQPGDDLATLGSGAQTAGKVPHADGAGHVAWLAPAGLTRIAATFRNGKPGTSEVLLRFLAPSGGTTFPAGLSESRAKAKAAATSSAVFSITEDGTQVGTMTFAAAATVATFAMAANTTLADGQMLEVVSPAVQDATLADIAITLVGATGT